MNIDCKNNSTVQKRVVVTGMGIVSSIGNNIEEVIKSLQTGTSGITESEEFKNVNMKSQVCGNIKNKEQLLRNVENKVNRHLKRFMNESSLYASLAMYEAIENANLQEYTKNLKEKFSDIDKVMELKARMGLVVGTGGSSPKSQYTAAQYMLEGGLGKVGACMVPKGMSSGVAACLATNFGLRGISYSISSACATSTHCIGHAVELIKMGKQDIVFAGGAEELSWHMACEFDAMKALYQGNNYKKACCPFDVERKGFVVAEGAAILVIEELEHAIKRKAPIFAEIVGYGATSDGYDMVSPSGEGAIRCMEVALSQYYANCEECGSQFEPIDYVNAHATSTHKGDLIELRAISQVLNIPTIDKNVSEIEKLIESKEFINVEPVPLDKGTEKRLEDIQSKIKKYKWHDYWDKNKLYVSSTKSMTGHSLGAAGAQEAVFSILMINNNFIAPNINLSKTNLLHHSSDIKIPVDMVNKKVKVALSNSFGFGGANACLIFKEYKP